jgi:beta-lactamase class A
VGGERLLQLLESPRFGFYDRAEGGACGSARAATARRPSAATPWPTCRTAPPPARRRLAEGRLFEPRFNALMLDALSRPGIRHKFVAGLAERPQAVLWRESGTWQDRHADSALVESGGHRFAMVAIARSPEGVEWLRRLAAPLHDLIVPADAARLALGRH